MDTKSAVAIQKEEKEEQEEKRAEKILAKR